MTDGPSLPPPGAPVPTEAPAPAGPTWWKKKYARLPAWAWIVIGVVIAAIAIGALSSPAEDDADTEVPSADTTAVAEPADTAAETTAPDTAAPETTQAPTTTAAPTTIAPTTAPPATGTRANPNPIGTTAEVGEGWSAAVNSVIPDATGLIMETNQFNDEPAPGNVYMMVSVTATFAGPEESNSAGIQFALLGPSNVVQEQTFVVTPDPEYTSNEEVFAGGSVTGNIVFEVPAGADLSTYVLIGQAYFSFDDEDRSFFALI